MSNTPSLGDAIEFAENPEPRCPCVLLLDTSASMQGAPISALNQGLQTFRDDLIKDPLASQRVEVAVITFDSNVTITQEFVTADQFEPPTMTAQGLTCMGSGINTALDSLQARRTQYRENGIAYYRPWVFMITDGEPQGESENAIGQAMQRIKEDEANKRVAFFTVGVENANMSRLSQIAVRTPIKLRGLNFTEMFLWLSASMSVVSQAKIDEQKLLPPVGWGAV